MAALLVNPIKTTTELDNLPEELLEAIILYLGPPFFTLIHSLDALQDLSNLSKVSKKFRRISEPHLYSSINIIVNRVGLKVHAPIESWG